jgi:hypothetical protein
MVEKTGVCLGRAVESGGDYIGRPSIQADLQVVVATVEAWEFIGHIKIIEIREENRTAPAAALRA